MEYKILSQEEKDRIVVEFMLAQERDHFCHTINKERYENILADPLLKAGTFKANIEKLKADTESRLVEVEKIIINTIPQLPTQLEIDVIKEKIILETVK
jgi:hypothetical protein